ncbi:MAG: hypothetical protein ACRBF0_24235 [Calditrichia bacterium]
MKIINLLLTLLVFCLTFTVFAQERPEVIDAYLNEPYGDNLFRRKGIMDGNQLRTQYFNQGEVGKWPDQPSGEWPKGSGHSYLDGVAVLVGARVNAQLAGVDTFITPVEAAYREHFDRDPISGTPWGWEPVPGYSNPDVTISDAPAISNDSRTWPTLWPNAIFTFLDQPQSEWINQAEVNGEPGEDDDRDGVVDNFTYWYGFFGRGVKNADIESFYVMDDASDKEWTRPPYEYFPIAADQNRGGLGLRVEVRGFQWSQVLAEDNIFWLYDIVNLSDTTYDQTAFGFLTDVGIGGTADSGDDNASFDLALDLAYGWDEDGIGRTDFGPWEPTGYLGYAYLESPGNPFNGFDDDGDGIVDERRDDGIDNDGDWAPFRDLNNNGTWESNEPLNDDLGRDGVGPFDRQYNGPDEGEGDGLPTPGEPDFDRTDVDESDQIGLNSMSIYRLVDGGGGDGWPKHDEGLWRRMTYFQFDTTLQRSNIQMLFASGPFELEKGTRERFSMALLNGSNLEDLIFNKITVQNIYNANYNFSRPPFKPLLNAVPGDGRIFLYWDRIAEESRDPFLLDSLGNPRKDFEGYLIYRSTEAQFNDIKLITDSRGEARYWKPIAQYDLINDIEGPDPVGINGARFWRGSNSGLQYSFVDTDVTNGQRYFYAVVAYDQGDPNFGTSGLPPSETTKNISEDAVGNINFIDINCAVVTPNAPSAGYIPPEISGDLSQVQSGIGTGNITAGILDPEEIAGDSRYRIEFQAEGEYPLYTTSTYSVAQVVGDSAIVIEEGIDAIRFGEDNPSPPVDGLVFTVYNDTTVALNPAESGWLIGSSNLDIQLTPHTRFPSLSEPWPADYRIIWSDTPVDTTFNSGLAVNFRIFNITENRFSEFEVFDNDNSGGFSVGDDITIIEFLNGQFRFAYDVVYGGPIDPNATPEEPVGGDEYFIATTKPFFDGDYFELTTKAATTSLDLAREELDRIKVVPNPYIAGASWEGRNAIFGAGRGERRIDFIHLPAECTIRIFTLSGKLVKKIEHSSPVLDGSQPWNLISEDGTDVAYGVYVFHIDAPNVGRTIGKFALVK